MSQEVDRKKPFSSLEKDLFLNIIQKYDSILSSKQTNATSALKKKQSWENIAMEFNESSIVTQKASRKQLIKLWYNMKAKARESKTKENIRHLTGGGPSVMDMDPIDSKVMDIDKNILTNIAVDIDSDIDGSVVILGNNEAWCKVAEATIEVTQDKKEAEFKTPIKKSYENLQANRIDILKCKILEEELEFKKRMHEEDLQMKILERKHKEKLFEIEIYLRANRIDILKCKILEEELEFKKRMHEEDLQMKILERKHKEKLFEIEIYLRANRIDILKCKILEEELEFKKRMHEEDLQMKILERKHKEKLFEIEIQIKLKELEKYDN